MYKRQVLALSLTLLVELAFQFCRIHDKRAGIRTREWAELDDEEASGPIDAPAPIGAASGLGTANAIDRPAPISTDAEPDAGGYGSTSISGRARTPNFFDDVL